MKKTTLTLIAIATLTTMVSANGYNFASTQSVQEVNTTVQTATKDVSLSGNTLTFTKINATSSVVDLSSISASDSFKDATFDGATKKLTFTLGDGTTQEINLAGAGSNVNLDTVTYDKPTKKLTFTLTDGNTADVILTLDKSDIGLSDVDNTSDADKPISTAVATALAEKKVVDVDLNENDEIVITYNDGTSKTL